MNPVCSSIRQIEHYPSLSNMYAPIPLRTTTKADLSSPLIKYAKKNLSIVRFAAYLVSILGELQQSEIDALQRGGEPKNGAGHEEVHQRRHDHEAEVSGGPAVLSIASGTAGEVVRHLRQELHFHIQLQLRARVRPVRYRCPPQPEGDGIHRRGRDTADVIRRRLPRLRRSRSPSTNSRKQPRASQTFVRW